MKNFVIAQENKTQVIAYLKEKGIPYKEYDNSYEQVISDEVEGYVEGLLDEEDKEFGIENMSKIKRMIYTQEEVFESLETAVPDTLYRLMNRRQ